MLKRRNISHRYLIINADDWGLSDKTNNGIIQARQQGVLTSASLMVLRPAAKAAANYAIGDPLLSVGLHVDLGDWNLAGGQWWRTDGTVDLHNPAAVAAELHRQLDRFRDLMGRDPTHLDSHQHVHMGAELLPLFCQAAVELGINLRSSGTEIRYCGAFFGADDQMVPQPEFVSPANLIHLFDQLPVGMTELSTHPGLDGELSNAYRDARPVEVKTLCDPAIRQALADRGIILVSFADVATICGRPPNRSASTV